MLIHLQKVLKSVKLSNADQYLVSHTPHTQSHKHTKQDITFRPELIVTKNSSAVLSMELNDWWICFQLTFKGSFNFLTVSRYNIDRTSIHLFIFLCEGT